LVRGDVLIPQAPGVDLVWRCLDVEQQDFHFFFFR
jgi:hypothetical protein